MMTRNDTLPLPALGDLKAQAKRLRETLAASGTQVAHSAALEMLAAQHGYRDWNTMHAAAGRNTPPTTVPVVPGDRVSGHYLGQPFTGEVLATRKLSDGAHFRVTLQFDQPVDVVTFDSFSSYRQRVNGTVDAKGVSPQRTSDGAPQLVLSLDN